MYIAGFKHRCFRSPLWGFYVNRFQKPDDDKYLEINSRNKFDDPPDMDEVISAFEELERLYNIKTMRRRK